MRVALTVAGSDSGAGAGIQADILTMSAMGVFATSAITSLTAQNPDTVAAIEPVSASFMRAQLEAVGSYFDISAAKTGMVFSAELADVCADFFAKNRHIALVVDPVMISTSGARLLSDDASEVLLKRLAPLSRLVTPNLPEACAILSRKEIRFSEMSECARELGKLLKTAVLLKGGHLEDGEDVVDVLFDGDGICEFVSRKICGVNTHGSGCTLSAAIAAQLALGRDLKSACGNAHAYLHSALENPLSLGDVKFINHGVSNSDGLGKR